MTTLKPPDSKEVDLEWLVNQIAHALRNPIFAASVQTEALQLRLDDTAAVIKTTEKLRGQLRRLSTDIDEMLLFGRPITTAPETTAVAELMATLVDRYRAGDRQDPAEVTLDLVDRDLVAVWDRRAVTVILERVLDNAVQHTDEPHAIELTVAETDGVVEVTVSDRGDGIDDEILDRATLPFYPQHSGRPGLGLAIADKFTRALGGTLAIESARGEGTTVRCTLPIRIEP